MPAKVLSRKAESLNDFGVEIETIFPTKSKISGPSKALYYVMGVVDMSYKSDSRFSLHYDRSLRTVKIRNKKNRETFSCYGVEFSSKILNIKKRSDLSSIKKMTNFLIKSNSFVTSDCGLHVHINTKNLSERERLNIMFRYLIHEKTIEKMMPRSRNKNIHCTTMFGYFEKLADYVFDETGCCFDCFSVQDIREMLILAHDNLNENTLRGCVYSVIDYDRHYRVCQSVNYNTLEFRHHHGTIDSEEIIHWVKFLNAFCKAGFKNLAPIQGDDLWRGVPSDVQAYYKAKIRKKNKDASSKKLNTSKYSFQM